MIKLGGSYLGEERIHPFGERLFLNVKPLFLQHFDSAVLEFEHIFTLRHDRRWAPRRRRRIMPYVFTLTVVRPFWSLLSLAYLRVQGEREKRLLAFYHDFCIHMSVSYLNPPPPPRHLSPALTKQRAPVRVSLNLASTHSNGF